MPCDERMRSKWNIVQEELQQMERELPSTEELREKGKRAIEEMAGRVKKAIDDHKKELENLRKRLREATSELEKRQLEKEIAEVEEDLEELQDVLEEIRDFFADLERRTIRYPKQSEKKE